MNVIVKNRFFKIFFYLAFVVAQDLFFISVLVPVS